MLDDVTESFKFDDGALDQKTPGLTIEKLTDLRSLASVCEDKSGGGDMVNLSQMYEIIVSFEEIQNEKRISMNLEDDSEP